MAETGQTTPQRTLGWRWAAAVFAVALALRLAYFPTAAADPTFAHPFLDALWNLQHASAIAHGRIVAPEPFYRAPLYTYALAVLLVLSRGSLLLVHLGQLILGSITAVLVGMLGARLFGRGAGALAGLLYGTAATVLFFDFELLNSAVFLPLAVAALLATEHATRDPSPARFFAAGLAIGFAAIARPDILAFAPAALALAVLAARGSGWRPGRILAAGGLLCAGLASPIAPVTAYNLLAGRDAVLISSEGGVAFFVCNNPAADGYTATMPGPTDTASYATDGIYTDNIESSGRYGARLALHHDPKPSEVSRYWTGRALAWIAQHPGAWARLTLRRAYFLLGGFEIGDQKNLTYFLETWWPFRVLPRWWWLFPLAVAALTLPGDHRGRLLLAAFAVTYGAVLVIFVPEERLRLAIYPAVCILAARLLVASASALRARRSSGVALRLAFAAALVPVMMWDPIGYSIRERTDARIARAQLSERGGDAARAEQLFLEALAIDPGRPRPRHAYAAFLARHGRESEARAIGGLDYHELSGRP